MPHACTPARLHACTPARPHARTPARLCTAVQCYCPSSLASFSVLWTFPFPAQLVSQQPRRRRQVPAQERRRPSQAPALSGAQRSGRTQRSAAWPAAARRGGGTCCTRASRATCAPPSAKSCGGAFVLHATTKLQVGLPPRLRRDEAVRRQTRRHALPGRVRGPDLLERLPPRPRAGRARHVRHVAPIPPEPVGWGRRDGDLLLPLALRRPPLGVRFRCGPRRWERGDYCACPIACAPRGAVGNTCAATARRRVKRGAFAARSKQISVVAIQMISWADGVEYHEGVALRETVHNVWSSSVWISRDGHRLTQGEPTV
jgi:hypothetical protein